MRGHIESFHEGKKPHKCPFCENTFSLKGALKTHIELAPTESVHEGKNKSVKNDNSNRCLMPKEKIISKIEMTESEKSEGFFSPSPRSIYHCK